MFIGHYAPALVAAALPKAPKLGILFFAAQLVDIAFFIFVLGGVEAMRLQPKITVMNGLDLYHMPYTHSLLGSIIWGGAFAAIIWAVTRNSTSALIAGGVVVSHWFVDLLVHRPDLTLAGSPPNLGMGLWNYPMIAVPLELLFAGGALAFYLSRTRHISGTAKHWPWTLGIVMLLVQLYNWLSPDPKMMDASLPLSALLAYGLFAWLAFKTTQTRAREGAGET